MSVVGHSAWCSKSDDYEHFVDDMATSYENEKRTSTANHELAYGNNVQKTLKEELCNIVS